jgi:mitochondrial genome maintenance exonuclease 1
MFSDGRGFHTAVESVLKGAQVESVEVPERNEGHWQSLRHVFKDISEVVSVEERIRHPFLCYKGVTDCVISLEGQQSVVEWKTSSTRKDTIEALYDNPIQVAAYLGAINFDENFADRKLQVSNGAVIVAYNSGEPASVVRFDYSLVRPFWALWLKRLQQYWRLASFDKSLPARKV